MLSTREMQTHLGVSRNTVREALDRLDADGYIVTRQGVGTFVTLQVPVAPKPRVRRCVDKLVPSSQAYQFLKAQAIEARSQGGIAFRPGIPALEFFPLAQFNGCFRQSDWAGELLDYPQKAGLSSLRSAIANRLRQTRGIACSPEQVIITLGAQAAFALILRVLLHDDDAVIIEDPCYPNLLSLLRSHDARIVPVPVDDDGINADMLRNVQAKAAFVTPSHQYPTGAVLSLERRVELLGWAAERGAWIIEDDYDSEFNYTGRPLPPLQGLDDNHRVIYVGTFSKVLSPALRIGYIVVPESLIAAFEAAHEIMGAAPPIPIQAALARFIDRGHLGRHVSKMRTIYDERRRFVSSRLAGPSGSPFTIRDSARGLHLIAQLPPTLSDVSVSAKAAEAGVALPALSKYYVQTSAQNGLVVGYAGASIPAAEAAIDALFDTIISEGSLTGPFTVGR